MVEARTQASLNGTPTVLLQIRKQSGTNTVEVANNLKERLATLQQSLLPGYSLRIVRDEADYIEASIATVAGAPRRRLAAGRVRRAALPRQLPLDDHRRHLDSHLDHRDLRADLVHGLHAQHA